MTGGGGRPDRRWVVTAAPWVRAPLLALRQPGVLLAVAAAAAVLGIVAASVPLFLSSARTAELARIAAGECPEEPAVSAYATGVAADRTGPADRAVLAAARGAGLPRPYRVLLARAFLSPVGSDSAYTAVLYERAGVSGHLPAVARAGGDPRGVWLPPDVARSMGGVRPGGTVWVSGTPVRVAGLYGALTPTGRVPRYWCSWSALVQPDTQAEQPPVFVPVETGTLERLALPVEEDWYSPAPAGLTVAAGHRMLRRAGALGGSLARVRVGGPGAGHPLVRVTGLRSDVDRATLAGRGLRGPVVPVGVAGVLVALSLVAAAGWYWAERRAGEVRLLTARGVAPAALGFRAALELVAPCAVGLVAGAAAAVGLVRRLGPSPVLEPGGLRGGLLAVAAAGAGGLLLLGTVAARRSRAWSDGRRARRGRLARTILVGRSGRRAALVRAVPWELALVGVAALLRDQARHDGVRVDHLLVQVPARLVAFPMLGLAGAVLLAARVCVLSMPALRRAAGSAPPALYLASRRLTGTPVFAGAVLVATALPTGLLTYAATVGHSTDVAVTAKSRVSLGAPLVVVTGVPGGRRLPTAGRGTRVAVVTDAVVGGDRQAQALGVDPATFARYAYDVTRAPLGDLVGRLGRRAPTGPGGAFPAILVDARPGNGPAAARVPSVGLDGVDVPLRVVATERVFPGLRLPAHPMVVVPAAALARAGPYTRRQEEVWTSPSAVADVLAAMRADHVEVSRVRVPADVLSATDLVTVTWVLGYLQALAILVGALAATGLLLYLAARQRRRFVSYVVGRRLGVRRRTHLASLVVEIGAVTGVGTVLGAAAGLACVALVDPLLDVSSRFPPAPAVSVPLAVASATPAAVAVVVVACALGAQRTADRGRPAEVTRLGA